MKPLPTEVKKNGFDFRQVKRSGDIAMFSKTKPGWRAEFYEVFIVQRHESRKLPNGIITEAKQLPPPDESWGTKGWSFARRSDADRKFYELGE